MTECFLWLLARCEIRMQGLASDIWLKAHDEPNLVWARWDETVRTTIARWLP